MKNPLVSILLVTYNSEDYLDECIKSVILNSYNNHELIIVDNNSTDKTKSIISKYKKKYPKKVVALFEDSNHGYAISNNIAAQIANGEYLFILNPDTVVDEDFLKPLVTEIKNKDVVAVQPIVYLFDKKTVNLSGKVTHYLAFDWLKDFKAKSVLKKQRIYSFSGSGVLLDRKIFLELGGFDEFYFMYYEDSDLSWKINLINKKIIFNPLSKLFHDYKYVPEEGYQSLKQKLFYIERNRLITMLKNYSIKSLLLIFPACLFMEAGMFFYALSQGWAVVKLKTYLSILFNFKVIWKNRIKIQKLRKINDKNIFQHLKPKITFEKFSNPIIKFIVNPILELYYLFIKYII